MIRSSIVGLMLIAVIYVLSYPVYFRVKYGTQSRPGSSALEQSDSYESGYQPVEMAIDSSPIFGRAMISIASACGSDQTLIFKTFLRAIRLIPPENFYGNHIE